MHCKVASLIGFAIRSGSILYGLDRIRDSRVRPHLIIIDTTAGDNTRKGIDRIVSERAIPYLSTLVPLEDTTGKQNCKVIAILDKNLARGIRDNLNPNYIEVK